MSYGAFFPQPERYGGARPLIQTLLDSLNAQMGTAYDISPSSPVYIRNYAIARCIADVWNAAEKLKNQFDPLRMTDFLPRWERILNLTPSPTDSGNVRRRKVNARFQRIGRQPTHQAVQDIITEELSPITAVIQTDTADTANFGWPYSMGRVFSLGTTPPQVTVTGIPLGSEELRIDIPSGGSLGAATFRYSLDNGGSYSAPIVTAATYAIPGSPLTLAFPAGTYNTDNVYYSTAYPDSWFSSVAFISVQCTKPDAMSEREFQERTGSAWNVLDNYCPAWVQFNFTRGSGFILDLPNLDLLRFST